MVRVTDHIFSSFFFDVLSAVNIDVAHSRSSAFGLASPVETSGKFIHTQVVESSPDYSM